MTSIASSSTARRSSSRGPQSVMIVSMRPNGKTLAKPMLPYLDESASGIVLRAWAAVLRTTHVPL